MRTRGAGLLLVLLTGGCRLVHMDPLEVTSWEPDAVRVHNPESVEKIAIEFSSPIDRSRTEGAFDFSVDNRPVSGRFDWNSTTMYFTPDVPVEAGHDYRISLTGEAQDIHGNALSRDFEHAFTTRRSDTRPEFVASNPTDGSVIPVSKAIIDMEFSSPLQRPQFYESIEISPSFPFAVDWKDGDRRVRIRARRNLTAQTDYTITIAADATDLNGNTLAEPVEITVKAEETGPYPQLTELRASHEAAPPEWLEHHTQTPVVLPDHPGESTESSVSPLPDWERFWGVELKFNTPVERTDVLRSIEFDPELPFSIEPAFNATSESFTVIPERRPDYRQDYTIRVNGAVRSDLGMESNIDRFGRFSADGPSSRIPEIQHVFFLQDPDTGLIAGPLSDHDELDLSAYPLEGDTGFFDLYIKLAAGAEISPFELADGFSFSVGNSAADLELLHVVLTETEEKQSLTPTPISISGAHTHIARFIASIEDLENAGVVTLSIQDSAADTFGNTFENQWRLRLNQVSSQ